MNLRRPPQNQNWQPPYGYYNGPGYYHGHPQIKRKKAPKPKRSDHMTWRGIFMATLWAVILVASIWGYVQLGGGAK